ncbi:glycosyltransferase [Oerskovia sp. Root918]|uniref:glycosyltransferase n=1 Tax=Oerskovia sp. Root918 TaxID=1736607 RepID=UPI000A4D7572|nr:glycosyltransferase [Oerskovia sp. Root918]
MSRYLPLRPHRPRDPDGNEIVVVSLEAWDDHWRRNQYLVAGLLRADPTLRVLFVEPATDPLHELRRGFLPRPGKGLRRATDLEGVDPDRLWLYQPTKILPRRIDPVVDGRLAALTRRAARRAGLTHPVLWINDPAAANLLDLTSWPALYDVTDDWLAANRTSEELRRLAADERTLLVGCGEVVVCSEHLARSKGADRAVTLITNAVDLDRYRRPVPRPPDLPAGPVALYLGTVHHDRFDVPTLLRTARELDGTGTVVLVGPLVDLSTEEVRALRAAGVRLLGSRPWSAVPGYLQHATVLLVPHLVNDFTDSLDPIKLYEYRAVGRPVVATPVAGFRDTTDPQVTVAAAADFASAVREILSAPGTGAEDRLADVAEDVPTWEGQTRRMAEVIERLRSPVPTRR